MRSSWLCRQERAPCYVCCILRMPSTRTKNTNDAQRTFWLCSWGSKIRSRASGRYRRELFRVFPCKRTRRGKKRLVDKDKGKARHSRRHTHVPGVQKHGIKCVASIRAAWARNGHHAVRAANACVYTHTHTLSHSHTHIHTTHYTHTHPIGVPPYIRRLKPHHKPP